MTTESMSIHRALVELKTIDSRIIKKIDSAKFCVAAKAKATKLGAITVDEFKTSAQASYDSAMDLINRRNAIKAAVSKSNAVTEISVNNKTYTVAEAISLKQHGMEYLDYLRSHIQAQYSNETSQITSANLRVEAKADDMANRSAAAIPKPRMPILKLSPRSATPILNRTPWSWSMASPKAALKSLKTCSPRSIPSTTKLILPSLFPTPLPRSHSATKLF